MAGFDLDWNGPALLTGLVEPFHQANEVLGNKFQDEITANKWQWPNPPSPRDIVDHGDLRRSYVSERTTEGGTPAHDHSWSQDYAMAVHEGAQFKDGRSMPGRPWTKEPLRNKVLEDAFEKLAASSLGRIK